MPDAQRTAAYHPIGLRGYFAQLAPDFDLIPQTGADLGVTSHCYPHGTMWVTRLLCNG